MRRTAAVVAAALLSLAAPAIAAPPATEAITWPIPWEPGRAFVYETESIETKFDGTATQRTRSTDTTTLSIQEGGGGGLVQAWTFEGFEIELLEGEGSAAIEGARAAAKAFEGVPLLVKLDAEASYAGFANLEDIAGRLREALRPVMVAGVEQGISESLGPDANPRDVETAKAAAMSRLDDVLANLTSPAVVEAMLKRQVETFNAFTGVELEPGATYEAEVEQENPLGKTPIPSRIEFGLFLPEAHPGDVLLEWTSTIDSERGTDAIWEIAEAMTGVEIPREARDGLPEGVSVSDAGFFLFDRETGVPEMFEMERTVVLGNRREYERTRMRLINGAHAHDWAPDPGAPAD